MRTLLQVAWRVILVLGIALFTLWLAILQACMTPPPR